MRRSSLCGEEEEGRVLLVEGMALTRGRSGERLGLTGWLVLVSAKPGCDVGSLGGGEVVGTGVTSSETHLERLPPGVPDAVVWN